MERVRINFHAGYGAEIYNNLQQAFNKEFGRPADFYSGYYDKKDIWQSELTEWISSQGYPCRAWCMRTRANGLPILEKYLPVGIELESSASSFFVMRWL